MYESEKRVGLDESDKNGRMNLSAIIKSMVDCGCFQTEDHVYDIVDMMKKGRGWFLISWQVRINRRPRLCERIKIQTFPYAFSGFIGKRYFKVLSDEGELLLTANSLWTWMDLKSSKPLRITDEMKEKYDQDDPPEEEWPGRKVTVFDDMKPDYEFTVTPLLLDTNGHMNNACYIDATERCLPEDAEVSAF